MKKIASSACGNADSSPLASWVIAAFAALIGATLRITFSSEEGSVPNIDDIFPGIYPFWHRCVLPSVWVFRKRKLAVMTSQSRDGEYIARVIERYGFVAVRGSSSRGGQRALLEMRRIVADGGGVAFTIDGPRGPRYVAKRGPVLLARETGVRNCSLLRCAGSGLGAQHLGPVHDSQAFRTSPCARSDQRSAYRPTRMRPRCSAATTRCKRRWSE